jgi:tricorn protease
MKRFALALFVLLLSFASVSLGQDEKPLLSRQPTLSRTEIAFMYGDDLWKVGREGGDAIRLTAGPGIKRGPHFSPDGKWIAFTSEYDGKLNVYVISADGGTPRR